MSRTIVEVRNLSKRFDLRGGGEFVAIEGVSFDVEEGCIVAIIGPSGCGKSTLLHILAGLDQSSQGTVTFKSADTPAVATNSVATVFQRPRLMPWRTVLDNVAFSMEAQGHSRATSRAKARQYIELVGLSKFETRYPHQISGGMQQRVAIARGLAVEPAILLLDEPFGALDALTRTYLQEELLAIVQRTGKTAVLVTHDIDEAIFLSNKVLVMGTHPGHIKAEIPISYGPNRNQDELLKQPDYAELRATMRRLLRPELSEEVA